VGHRLAAAGRQERWNGSNLLNAHSPSHRAMSGAQ
jgi:hypothetical protein